MEKFKIIEKRNGLTDMEDALLDAKTMLDWGIGKDIEDLKKIKWGSYEIPNSPNYGLVPLILFSKDKDVQKSNMVWHFRYDVVNHRLFLLRFNGKEYRDGYMEMLPEDVIPTIKRAYTAFESTVGKFTTGSFAGFIERGEIK